MSNYDPSTSTVEEIKPSYDLDGNMLTNCVWSYSWDAENRLTAVYSNNTLLISSVYDHQSRRIAEIVSHGGTEAQRRDFVYDDWNIVSEVRCQSSEVCTNYYCWGLDLSGTLQGSGGVGGLLTVVTGGMVASPSAYFPCFDANGNVTEYVDATASIVAHYAFDAFGNTIAKGGDMVDVFHFWYSTKYLDHDTGLYYYGYRYYSPMLQRWINRDPIEEEGGLNLYGFCENNSISSVDCFGKFSIYVETLGSGHVGIMDENGTGYDYGRYFASYLGLPGPFSGPNILRKINGWSSDDQRVLHSVFKFNVCPRLDKLVTEALELKFSQGQKTLPSSVLKKYLKPPSRKLTENERYMGSDWTPNNNCITFTFGTITTALSPIVRNPKNFTQTERKQAMAILAVSYAAAWQVSPVQIKWMLEQASLFDWIKSSKTGGQNDKKNDANSCCGSST